MQIETPTRSDFSSNSDIVEPREDAERTDDNGELEWRLLHQIREPILWPRIFPGLLARLSAFQAARHRVSTNRFNKVTGISTLPEPDRDIEKLGGAHKTRRTAAIASLKVGRCFWYQAVG
jgi:hypothetical protein